MAAQQMIRSVVTEVEGGFRSDLLRNADGLSKIKSSETSSRRVRTWRDVT